MPRRFSVLEFLSTLTWIAAASTLALLLSSLFRSTNLTVCLATVALCGLAILRPGDAMLVSIAFIGFGDILGHISGVPTLRAEEAIVVASLFGWCARSVLMRGGRHALRYVNAAPVGLLGITAVCSLVVWMRVSQVQTTYASSYLADLWHCLTTQYFVNADQFMDVASTAVLLESLALYLAVAAMCHVDRAFFDRAVRMLIVGGSALGVLSVVRVIEISLRNPNAVAMLRATYAGLRISPQIPDYIAAAAYFVLCWTAAIGLALQQSRQRLFMVVASLALLGGLFLTGSRSGIGAAAGGICALAYLAAGRSSRLGARRVIGFAIVVLVVFAIAFPKLIGHDLAGATAGESLTMRAELLKSGVRVLETHPLFGVGLDRFFLYVDRFASPQLNAMWKGRKNPHNDFLRIATEFGLVGLALFLWILAGCANRIRQRWRMRGDVRLAGLVGGLVAFSITMLISNPLMVHPVSYAFWIALALATGEATAPDSQTAADDDASRRRLSRRDVLAALVGTALLVSVPFRAAREVKSLPLTGITYGLYDWSLAADGTLSRLSGGQATLFIPADARVVEIALRGTLPTGGVQTVRAFVDGRLANELAVGRERQRLRILLTPNAAARPRRIDLHVAPTWSPADVDRSSTDHRTLGVEVEARVIARGMSPAP